MLRKKDFTMSCRLSRPVNRDGRVIRVSIELLVSGTGFMDPNVYEQADHNLKYSVKLKSILWEGAEVLELLDLLGHTAEAEEAAITFVRDNWYELPNV